jgi:hypothetical protein
MKTKFVKHDETKPKWFQKAINSKQLPQELYNGGLQLIDYFQKREKEKGIKVKAYLKDSAYGKEIILGNSRVFYYQDKSRRKYLWIFNQVKRQAKEFIEKETIIEKTKYPTILYNNKFKIKSNETIAWTDIDDAYWKIAKNIGVISKKLFLQVLIIEEDEALVKEIRNAALANLGSDKMYEEVEDMIYTGKRIIFKADPKLKMVHNNIVNTCSEIMYNLSVMLGNDFKEYRTDEITYRRTKENVKIVNDYIKKHNLLCTNTYERKKKEPTNTN